MATSAPQPDWEKYRGEEHQAFVLGYTGGIGQAIVNELAASKLYKKVVLIGRREVVLGANIGPEFEQKVVDFEKLEEYADVFDGLDTGFCAMGHTQLMSSRTGFVKVDHDYVLHAAELAVARGCKHFNVVTSKGTNKNSFFHYLKVKGRVEEALKQMDFERLSIFRPGGILHRGGQTRTIEKVSLVFLKPIIYFSPTSLTVHSDILSRAMVNNAVTSSEQKVDVFENRDIHELAAATGSPAM